MAIFAKKTKMGRRKKPHIENVHIEALAAEGNGLAHVDGKVLFVQKAIPGDVVDVQVNKVRSGYSAGYITRMVHSSPCRLEPFCDHYGVCGGCTWQPLPYPMQIDFKRQQVEDQLKRIGHLELPPVLPTIGSEETVRYRNKMEYTFSDHRWFLPGENPEEIPGAERCGLGFHVGGFFDKVLDIKECHLQAEPSNAIRLFVKEYALEHGLSFFDLHRHEGFMRNIVVRITTTGEVMVVVIFGAEAAEKGRWHEAEALLEALKGKFPIITSLYYVVNGKCNDAWNDLPCLLYSGNEAIYEQMEEMRFKIGPKSFYQTNSRQAYRLYSVVRDSLREAVDKRLETDKPVIYDLYTGTGTIALFLSPLASKVIGIEYVPEAIEDARENARLNSVSNCEFFAGDMKDVLSSDFIAAHGHPDIVVLDPPRAGIHPDVAHVLLEAAPDNIIYVSCNPSTQARDLAIFSKLYDIIKIQPVDMFPHTTHVENIAVLVKRKSGDINLYTLTSALHDEISEDVLSEPFIKAVQSASGCRFILKGADFSDYGKGDDLIYVRTGGTEDLFRTIFTAPGSPALTGGKTIRLLTSGESNSLAASMEILSYLNSTGLRGRIIHGSAGEIANQLPQRDNASANSRHSAVYSLAPASRPLEGMRLAVVGKPSDWLISSNVDYAKARQMLGVELVDIPISEMVELYHKGGYQAPEGLHRLNIPKYGNPITDEDLSKAIKVYGALKEVLVRYNLNGLTLRCFDLLTSIGTTGCLALSLLNSEGYVATCEGDIPAMLSMALSRIVAGKSGFQVNLSRISGDRFLFAHCTVPIAMVTDYCYDTHFESGIGVAIHGELPPGPSTVFKTGAELDRFMAEDVELVSNEYGENLCRTQVVIRSQSLKGYMLEAPLGNHHIIIPGHHAVRLKRLLNG